MKNKLYKKDGETNMVTPPRPLDSEEESSNGEREELSVCNVVNLYHNFIYNIEQ
jgi:hypothetical protein